MSAFEAEQEALLSWPLVSVAESEDTDLSLSRLLELAEKQSTRILILNTSDLIFATFASFNPKAIRGFFRDFSLHLLH